MRDRGTILYRAGRSGWQCFLLAAGLSCVTLAGAQAQQRASQRAPSAPVRTTNAPSAPSPSPNPAIAARAQRAAPQATTAAPQVITVVHRLSGWKLLVWISRNSAQQVTGFDYQLLTERRAHTNIVAGYVLSDGRTVVARLPQAEAEIEPVIAPPELRASSSGAEEADEQQSEFLIVRHDGSQVRASFVGLDARTGLSVLRADEPLLVSAPTPRAYAPRGAASASGASSGASASYIAGQRVRFYAPAPEAGRATHTMNVTQVVTTVRPAPSSPPARPMRTAPPERTVAPSQAARPTRPSQPSSAQPPASPATAPQPDQLAMQRAEVLATTTVAPRASSAPVGDEGYIYMRLAEAEGRLLPLGRSPLLETARLSVRAEGLHPAFAGAVALAENGAFLGIVERLNGNEARLLPGRAAQSAAERVLARRTSIPQAWLGARGSAIAPTPAQIPLLVRHGWSAEQARAIARLQQGVLLTGIAPGAPAALAGLRPGDIVTRVGEELVRTTDDLTRLIRAAGAGAEVRFTVLRKEQTEPRDVLVRLGESFNPRWATEVAIARPHSRDATRVARPAGLSPFNMPLGIGLESIVLTSEHAAPFGRPSVMIVLTVRPGCAAFRLGLRPGDVILSVNGQPLNGNEWRERFSLMPAAGITLDVRRNNQQIRLAGSANASGAGNQ